MSTNGRTGGGMSGDADRDPRLDRLYREALRDEPPARLDAAILAAAHRAVGSRPRAASERLRAWRVPLSIAAVVVLSVSVVTLMRQEGADQLDSSTANVASRSASKTPAPQMAEEGAQVRDRSEPADAPDGRARLQKAPNRQAARDDAAPASAPAAKEEAAQPAEATSAKLYGDAEPGAPVPPPIATSPQSRPGGAGLRDSRPAQSTGSASGADVARSSIGVRGSSGDSLFAPSPEEQKPQGQVTPADRPAVRERAAAADSAGSQSMKRPEPPQPAAKAAPRMESRSLQVEGSAATANRLSPLVNELQAQPADKWLEKIEGLRRGGRRTEADELLAEFKRRFPDYPLPAALR